MFFSQILKMTHFLKLTTMNSLKMTHFENDSFLLQEFNKMEIVTVLSKNNLKNSHGVVGVAFIVHL